MNALLVVGCGAGGVIAGLVSGWAAVAIERSEKLEDEETEERLEYERDVADAQERARAAGEEVPAARPWVAERYGWTWLERVLSPVLAAVGFSVFAARDGASSALPIHLLWLLVFVHIVCFDVKHRLILNRITYPAILLAVALSPLSPRVGVIPSLVGGAGVALFFVILNLTSRGSIGLGDAKLGALIGAVTGAMNLAAVYAVIYGVLLGGAASVIVLITRVRGLKDPIPYGPFLCAGAAIMLYLRP